MTNWNPSPNVLGMQVIPDNAGTTIIRSLGLGVATRIESTVAETIQNVTVPAGGSNSSNRAVAGLDVYPAADWLTAGGNQLTDLLPNADAGGGGTGWKRLPGDGTTNLWQNIASNPDNPNLDTSIVEGSGVVGTSKHFNLNAASFTTSKRITGVSVRMVVFGGSVRCSLQRTGGNSPTLRTGSNLAGRRLVTLRFGEICPWTSLPWTQADIREFASNARVAIARDDRSLGYVAPQIWALSLQVEMWDEKRVAFGVYTPAAATNMPFPLYKPDGSAGWEKPGSGSFVFVLRPLRGGPYETASPSIRTTWFEGELPEGFGITGSGQVIITGSGQVSPVLGDTLDPNRVMALVMQRTDSTYSVDGSEYYTISDFGPSMRQRYPVLEPASYGSVTAVVKPPADLLDNGAITFRLQEVGGAYYGSEVTVTRGDLARYGRRLRNGWWFIRRPLAAPAAIGIGTYQAQIGGSSGWRVMTLGGSNDHGNAGYAGYDGYVDYFGQTGARDAAVTFSIAPDPPTGVTVTTRELPLAQTAPTGSCPAFPAMPYVRIGWDASDLDQADFGGYEVQRYDPVVEDWQTIALLESVAAVAVDDHEALLGAPSSYRVRTIRADGTPSVWTGDSTGPTTVTLPAPGAPGLWFTSSHAPDLGLAYMDVYGSSRPDREIVLRDAAETVYTQYFERDFQVAHRPTEHRGVSFSRRVLVDAESAARPSMKSFDALRRLTTSDLPAICVRDHEGNRWWAWVDAPGATLTIGGHRYMDLVITEVAGEPIPVTNSNLTLGGGWINLRGAFGADDQGAFVARVSDAGGGAVAAIDTGVPDGAIVATLEDPAPRTNGTGIAFRIVDENNFLFLRRNASFGQMSFGKMIGGSYSEETVGAVAATFTVQFSGSTVTGGTVVSIRSGGSEVASFTVAEDVFDGATMHGIYYQGGSIPTNGARWPQWQFYEPGSTLGAGWESWGGSSWRIEDQKALRFSTGGNPARGVAVIDTGLSDARIRMTLDAAQDRTRMIVRAKDPDNYLYARASRSFGTWQLFSRIDGVESLIATLGGSASDDLTVEMFLFGDRMRWRVNGGFGRRSGTDEQTYTLPPEVAFLQGETRHGIGDDTNHADGAANVSWNTFRVEPLRHWGVNGSALMSIPSTPWIGREIDVFQLPVPALGSSDAVAIMWGVNDAISTSAGLFARGIETVLSRLRAPGAVIDAGVLPKTGTWITRSGTDQNSGTSWIESSEPGAAIETPVELPADATGFAVAFIAVDGDGVAEVSVNGGPPRTVNIDIGEWGFEPIFVERFGAGVSNLKIEVISGTVAVDSIWPEMTDPRVAVANIAKFLQGADFTATAATATTVSSAGANWAPNQHAGATARIYAGPGAIQDRTIVSNTASTITISSPWSTVPVPGQSRIHVNQVGSPWGNITDAKIDEMNAATAAVVAGFPNATIVNIDDVLDRDPALFSTDGIHPSRAGHDALGAAFAARLGTSPVWNSLWVFGHSYSTGQGAGASGFDYHLARRLRFSERVADAFDRADDRGVVIDGDFDA